MTACSRERIAMHEYSYYVCGVRAESGRLAALGAGEEQVLNLLIRRVVKIRKNKNTALVIFTHFLNPALYRHLPRTIIRGCKRSVTGRRWWSSTAEASSRRGSVLGRGGFMFTVHEKKYKKYC